MRILYDDRLLAAARGGDVSALDRLLVLCRPNLRYYAVRHCYFADVDDAVQETLLIVTRHLPGLRSSRAFVVWLFQIVRRECQRLARKAHYTHLPLDAIAETHTVSGKTDRELGIDLVNAIHSLPDLYREVIVLRDFEELTIREIGERLDLLPATVKTRLHRGRQLVREYLLT